MRTIVERLWDIGHTSAPASRPQIVVTTLAASPAVFTVTVDGRSPVTVRVAGHLWDPRGYVDLAKALGAAAPAKAETRETGESERLLGALLDGTTMTLLTEDATLAPRLRPGTAAHEQAALILGVHALDEGAARFSDVRPALSRMTAHLAATPGGASGASATPAGVVARALLLTLIGRETEALAPMVPLTAATAPPAQQAWARVVRLRATGDWRVLKQATKATLRERVEYGRALSERLSPDALVAWLTETDQPMTVHWPRILLASAWSVPVGNIFAESSLPIEAAEALRASKALGHAASDPAGLAVALRDAPSAPVSTWRVLDWPLVAAAAERHLAARALAAYRQHEMLGHPDRLKTLPLELESQFGGLPLMSAALALMEGDDRIRQVRMLGDTLATLKADRSRIPAALWASLVDARTRRATLLTWPSAAAWFNPVVPDRTVFDVASRSAQSGTPHLPLPQIEEYHRLNPSDTWLSWSLAYWRSERTPASAEARALFGGVLDYDLVAYKWLWYRTTLPMPEAVQVATAMCELDVDECQLLAAVQLRRDEAGEASQEYRRWYARGRDRVGVANGVGWLVWYLHDTGQLAAAREIADSGDAVGSAAGFAIKAEQAEREGRMTEAEAGFRKISTRYTGDADSLGAFYLRQWGRSGDTTFRERGLALLTGRLPAGLEPVSENGTAPIDGLVFTNFGTRAEKAGLRSSDIVVGLDGYRTRNLRQWWVMQRLSMARQMTFTVWRDGRYERISAEVPQRTLGTDFKDYKPSSASR